MSLHSLVRIWPHHFRIAARNIARAPQPLLLVSVDAGAEGANMAELPREAVLERACLAMAHGQQAEVVP